VIGKLHPSEILFRQLVSLDHGAHGTVQNQDALTQDILNVSHKLCVRDQPSLHEPTHYPGKSNRKAKERQGLLLLISPRLVSGVGIGTFWGSWKLGVRSWKKFAGTTFNL
jgi:hypothetical protein